MQTIPPLPKSEFGNQYTYEIRLFSDRYAGNVYYLHKDALKNGKPSGKRLFIDDSNSVLTKDRRHAYVITIPESSVAKFKSESDIVKALDYDYWNTVHYATLVNQSATVYLVSLHRRVVIPGRVEPDCVVRK